MASPPYNPPSQSSLIHSFNFDDNLEPLWVPLLNLINPLRLKIRKVYPNPFETTLPSRRKNRLRPEVSQFCAIYNSVKPRYKSGSNEWYCYDLAHKEYYATYDTTFTLVEAGIKRELELEKPKLEHEEIMEKMRLTQQRELEAQRLAHQRQQLEFERERYEWKK
ncbi:hypothetical protein Tco_1549636 [Tanacetum coccineum]